MQYRPVITTIGVQSTTKCRGGFPDA